MKVLFPFYFSIILQLNTQLMHSWTPVSQPNPFIPRPPLLLNLIHIVRFPAIQILMVPPPRLPL
jgi:hypothetical protein